MRFSRLNPDIVHEGVVQYVETDALSPTIVCLECLVTLPFSIGDLLLLESTDGLCQWEAHVRFYGNPIFYLAENCQEFLNSVTLAIHNKRGSILLPKYKRISVSPPAPGLLVSPIEEVRRVPFQKTKKTNKARVNASQNYAKEKLKIGIHGFGSIERALTMIALDNKDVEVVAISDPTIIPDQTSCLFRDNDLHGEGWIRHLKMKDPSTILFGEKEVTLLRFEEGKAIPWNESGAEFIFQAYNVGKEEVCTREYNLYNSNANIFGYRLSPLAKILDDRFGRVEDGSVTCSVPSCLHINAKSKNAASAIREVLPQWKGMRNGSVFKLHTAYGAPVELVIELDPYNDYNLVLNNVKPNTRFTMLLGLCAEMIAQIPDTIRCDMEFL